MKRLELLLEDLTKAVEEEYYKLLLSDDEEIKEFMECLLRDLYKEGTPLGIWTTFTMTISCDYVNSDSLKRKVIETIVDKMGILTEMHNL